MYASAGEPAAPSPRDADTVTGVPRRTQRWIRPIAVAAATCATGLLAPAGATAAQIPAGDVVTFAAGTVHGYALEIRAARVQDSPALTVSLTKRTATGAQRHVIVFDAARHRPAFRLTRTLRSTRLRADLGPWGKIDVVATGRGAIRTPQAGPLRSGLAGATLLEERTPETCGSSRARERAAKITGTVRLTLDDTFFRTISRRGGYARGSLVREPQRTCEAPPEPRATRLVQQSGPWTLRVERTDIVLQDVQRQELRRTPRGPVGQRGDVTITQEALATNLPASALASAPDGATATVTGGGPALSGTLAYTAILPGGHSVGSVQGDLTVRFDGTPAVAPWSSLTGNATLTTG